MPPERRTVFGVSPNTIRLSVGIEKNDVLLKDLEYALNKLEIKSKQKTKINVTQKPPTHKGSDYADLLI